MTAGLDQWPGLHLSRGGLDKVANKPLLDAGWNSFARFMDGDCTRYSYIGSQVSYARTAACAGPRTDARGGMHLRGYGGQWAAWLALPSNCWMPGCASLRSNKRLGPPANEAWEAPRWSCGRRGRAAMTISRTKFIRGTGRRRGNEQRDHSAGQARHRRHHNGIPHLIQHSQCSTRWSRALRPNAL